MATTTEISSQGKRLETIPCLTIPLYDEVILLPNSAVAEVVSYIKPEVVENAPEWFTPSNKLVMYSRHIASDQSRFFKDTISGGIYVYEIQY